MKVQRYDQEQVRKERRFHCLGFWDFSALQQSQKTENKVHRQALRRTRGCLEVIGHSDEENIIYEQCCDE